VQVAGMTVLSDADLRFLERRKSRTRVGLYFGPFGLLLLFGAWVALYVWWPVLINPVHAAVHYGGVLTDKATVTSYAVSFAILFNLVLLVLALICAFVLLWARSERRYLRLLGRLQESEAALKAQAEKPALKAGDDPAARG
jgi:hypothetical protein